MPLHLPTAPPAALQSVLAAQNSPAAERRRRTRPAADSGPLVPELPLPLHEMTTAAPAGKAGTRLAGWRFVLRAPDAPSGSLSTEAAEAVLSADGWAFGYFCAGPYVTSAQQALRQAEALERDVQPRLLSVPQLYMLTLWLHADPAADPGEGAPLPSDVLVPLAPAPPGIAAHREHRADELLPLLTRRVVTSPLMRTPA